MPSTRSTVPLLLAALCAFASGCREEQLVTAPSAAKPGSATTGSRLRVSKFSRPDEDAFVALAAVEPSSAGFYADSASGEMIVVIADSGARFRAPNALRAALSRVGSGAANRGVEDRDLRSSANLLRRLAPRARVRIARYTFQELSDWRDSAFVHVLGSIPGVVYDDLDEVNNSVTLGVSSDAAGADARAKLISLGVPAAAIRLVPAATPKTSSISNIGSSSLPDTVAGGYSIDIYTPSSSYFGTCTAGIAIAYGTSWLSMNNTGMVTAMHCTTDIFSTSNAATARSSGGGSTWASEAYDPSATGIVCTPCRSSRGSDAAVFSVSGLPARKGTIAHPDQVSTSTSTNGSFTVDQSRPWFHVASAGTYAYVNERVDQVGNTSGWVSGIVSASCVDVISSAQGSHPSFVVRCTAKATLRSQPGDSGAPVFYRHDQTLISGNVSGDNMAVDLIGFISGSAGTDAYISSYASLYSEVANQYGIYLDALSDVTVSAPLLSGSVVSSQPQFTWTTSSATGLYGSNTPTYTVVVDVMQTESDEYDILHDTPVYTYDVGTTTGTSMVDPYNYVTSLMSNCYGTYAGQTWYRYTIYASIQGMTRWGNQICFE